MIKITREDIHIISRYSNGSEKSIDKMLKQEVYSSRESWHKFLRLFFISLGVGFSTAGLVFFFAYNWADLHKFIKMGLLESIIVGITLLVFFAKISLDIKNILLTGASIVVGILFAVFGQIYQTGANAYDFFFSWTIAVTLWVVISNFAPLWLVFIMLLDTTLILYAQQVAYDWSKSFVVILLLIIHTVFLITFLFAKKVLHEIKPPTWFTHFIALTLVLFSTTGIIFGIFNSYETSFFVLIIITSMLYGGGIKYGLNIKSSFYLSLIAFSIIVIVSAFLIKLSNNAEMLFFISVFVIAGITGVIKTLTNLQKK